MRCQLLWWGNMFFCLLLRSFRAFTRDVFWNGFGTLLIGAVSFFEWLITDKLSRIFISSLDRIQPGPHLGVFLFAAKSCELSFPLIYMLFLDVHTMSVQSLLHIHVFAASTSRSQTLSWGQYSVILSLSLPLDCQSCNYTWAIVGVLHPHWDFPWAPLHHAAFTWGVNHLASGS